MRNKKGTLIYQAMLKIVLFTLTLTIVIPFLNIIARSFSDPALSQSMKGYEIIPRGFSLINYQIILNNPYIIPSVFSSLFITLVGTVLSILLTMISAYALTRDNLPGKRGMMMFLILMMLFDPGLVPEYLVVKDLGLIGSRWSVILVMAVNVYYLIIMMRYFEEVPKSIYESALIDGAGHFKMLFSIFAPLCKPGIASITMFYGVMRWNEYVRSGIYIGSIKMVPLQVVLRKFIVDGDTATLLGASNLMTYSELSQIDYTALTYATIIIAIIPVVIIYCFVLRFYNKDLFAGGVKE